MRENEIRMAKNRKAFCQNALNGNVFPKRAMHDERISVGTAHVAMYSKPPIDNENLMKVAAHRSLEQQLSLNVNVYISG